MSSNRNNSMICGERGQYVSRALLTGLSAASVMLAVTAASSMLPADAAKLAHSRSAPAAATRAATPKSHVIVTFTGALTQADHARLAGLGCDIYRNLDFIHSAALTVPQANVGKLSSFAFVKNVSPDAAVQKDDEFTCDASQMTAVSNAAPSLNGKGITVALLDSGMISGCPEQQGAITQPYCNTRILANITMVPSSSYYDQCGHGTHVAGIIGGNGFYSTGPQYTHTFLGIARNCNFVNVRVLDGTGAGVASNVISGLQWCVKNKALYNIRVINLSLGQPVTQSYTTDPLCMAAEAAWKAGIVVVCAAGNDGRLNTTQTAGVSNYGYDTAYGTIHSPGNDPYVITVGATKRVDATRADDVVASYSSRGPTLGDCIAKPDIMAAGNKIISDLAQGSYIYNQYVSTNGVPMSAYHNGNNGNNSWNYFTLSGTSMAAPVVSGAATVMLQAYPNLSPDTVKARLMMSADALDLQDGTYDVCTNGAGYLDIPAALKSTVVVPSSYSAMSPTLYADANGNVKFTNNASLFGSQAVQNADGSWSAPATATVWGTGASNLASVYGSRALWGDNSVSSNRALWGDVSLTSSTTVNANRALWGDTSVYASRALWGDTSPQADLSLVAINGDN